MQDWQDATKCAIDGQQPLCTANTCHDGGHWMEVAFPMVSGMCDCAAECMLHPTATAYQFNAGGFCACLELRMEGGGSGSSAIDFNVRRATLLPPFA
jgi:hypothetical protein